MKLNSLLIPFFAVALMAQGLCEEEDPFEESSTPDPAPPRPERLIHRVPASIASKALEGRAWTYVISGFYPKNETEDEAKSLASTYSFFVPASTGVEINAKQRTCAFNTSRELTNSELAYAIDDLAHLGGGMPYWAELEARDLPKSEYFDQKHYSIEKFEGEYPTGLAWHGAPKNESFSIPLATRWVPKGEFLITPTTAYCICHSRFSIRVRGTESGVIWLDDTALFGSIQIASSDLDSDGAHEVCIRVSDHGKESQLILKPAAEAPSNPAPEVNPPKADR